MNAGQAKFCEGSQILFSVNLPRLESTHEYHASKTRLLFIVFLFVIDPRQILCSGSADDIVRHQVVREKYLGEIDIDSIGASKRDSAGASTIRVDQPIPTGVSGSKIVFSKPRTKKLNRVPSPFKSDDL